MVKNRMFKWRCLAATKLEEFTRDEKKVFHFFVVYIEPVQFGEPGVVFDVVCSVLQAPQALCHVHFQKVFDQVSQLLAEALRHSVLQGRWVGGGWEDGGWEDSGWVGGELVGGEWVGGGWVGGEWVGGGWVGGGWVGGEWVGGEWVGGGWVGGGWVSDI